MSSMTSRRLPHSARSREAGMVSIMVVMILMIVMSLIVIGFAQIARRNQRQSLDRQLSTSAFYAAESGVNDVRNLIKTYGPPPAKPDCTNGSADPELSYYNHLTPTLNGASGVKYTCVLVDPTPITLPYTINYQGTIIPLGSSSGSIQTLTITWQKSTTSATPISGCNGTLTTSTAWTCGYGVLRFDLVRTDGVLSNSFLESNTMSAFLVPVSAGGVAGNNVGFVTNGSADFTKITCTNTQCQANITAMGGGSQYYLRLASQYYTGITAQISGTDNAGKPVAFVGAQVLIDATGKAQDVLRRIQVRVPVNGTSANLTSDYALETTDSICKRYTLMTNHFQSSAATAVPTMDNSGNPLCQDH
jgi:Tfp pilus assembly protein PilX